MKRIKQVVQGLFDETTDYWIYVYSPKENWGKSKVTIRIERTEINENRFFYKDDD